MQMVAESTEINPADGSGTAPSTLPVWLNPDKFLEADFDAETCVTDLRRYVPLINLKQELESYLATLRSKLVEVINEDYNDYVSLSTRLVNVDGAVVRMRKPLGEIKEKLNSVEEAVKLELNTLSQGLRKRKEIANARAKLELLQEVAHVASKVEKLLAELQDSEEDGAGGTVAVAAAPGTSSGSMPRSSTTGGDDSLDARALLLDRVAGEVSRLTYLANRGKDLAFVKGLAGRVAHARGGLIQRLREALRAALSQRAWSAAQHCVHAHVELGEPRPVEEAVREIIVRPLVRHATAHFRAEHPLGPKEGGLWPLLSAVLSSFRRECSPLLDTQAQPPAGLALFDLPGGALLPELLAALTEEMPGVFSPGLPSAFHANCVAAQRFQLSLEALCSSRAAVDALRAAPASTALSKRWNTAVYFSLLYQQLAGELEDAACAERFAPAGPPPADTPAGPPLSLSLEVSAVLWRGLQRCVDPHVFLRQVGDKFFRLMLQLCRRYEHWQAAVVAARRDPTGASALQWVTSAPQEELVALVRDAEALADQLALQVPDSLAALLADGGAAGEAGAAASAALRQCSEGVSARGGEVLSALCQEVAEKCVAVVRQLRGITATYRMTTKGPPTRYSHYVTGALGPLRAFLDVEVVQRLSAQRRGAAAAAVVDMVCVRYAALAEELLANVRRTESSLRRLKKNRPDGGAPGADTAGGADSVVLSDSDKICLQLQLDVAEFGSQVARFGIEPSGLPSFSKLLESVSATDRVGDGAGD